MTLTRPIAALIVAAAVVFAGTTLARAQATVTEHITPGGIAFRNLSLPGDTHEALAFSWTDGAALALPGKEGLAVLGPRMLLEGTSSTDENARIETLKDLQATLGLGGSALYTNGSLAAPPAHFAEAAQLLGDLLTEPALPPGKLAKLRRSYAISSRQQQENAETLAARLFMRALLGDGPWLRLSLADPAAYEAVEIEDVVAWRRSTLGRDRLTIASAGPMAPEAVAAQIDRIFAGLPATAPGKPVPPPELRSPARLIVLQRPVVQTAIVAGGPTGWRLEPDSVRGTIGVRVLGGGFDSRLTKAVRERLGATYGIRAVLHQLHPQAFALQISTAVDNAKAAAALAAIRDEYERFLREGVTDSEIEPWKTRLATELREHLRRSGGAAQQLHAFARAGFPADYLATYEARLRALSAADVNEGIRSRLPKAPLTVVMVTPSAEGLSADCVIKAAEEISRCE